MILAPIFLSDTYTRIMAYLVKVNPFTTEQLNVLQFFLDTSNIPYTIVQALPSILPSMTSNPIYHIDRPRTEFKCIPEFKLFMGSENIRKKDILIFDDILERIYIYARTNKLLSHDSLGFHLDDTLQSLLKTFSKKIDWADLYQHISLLLAKVNQKN